jgi:hypothetical protein
MICTSIHLFGFGWLFLRILTLPFELDHLLLAAGALAVSLPAAND